MVDEDREPPEGWTPEPEELTEAEKAFRDSREGALKELALKMYVIEIFLRDGSVVEKRVEGMNLPALVGAYALDGYKTYGDIKNIKCYPLVVSEKSEFPKHGEAAVATGVFDVEIVRDDGSVVVITDIPLSMKHAVQKMGTMRVTPVVGGGKPLRIRSITFLGPGELKKEGRNFIGDAPRVD